MISLTYKDLAGLSKGDKGGESIDKATFLQNFPVPGLVGGKYEYLAVIRNCASKYQTYIYALCSVLCTVWLARTDVDAVNMCTRALLRSCSCLACICRVRRRVY